MWIFHEKTWIFHGKTWDFPILAPKNPDVPSPPGGFQALQRRGLAHRAWEERKMSGQVQRNPMGKHVVHHGKHIYIYIYITEKFGG